MTVQLDDGDPSFSIPRCAHTHCISFRDIPGPIAAVATAAAAKEETVSFTNSIGEKKEEQSPLLSRLSFVLTTVPCFGVNSALLGATRI